MDKKLMLIDGHSILNRAYYGLPPLTGSDGTPTGAIYGFLNIMFKFIDEENPDYLAVAFDVSAPTFRHKKYEEYKGTRKPMDPDLKIQVPLIKEILKAMNVPVLQKEGWEADDIIGTISKRKADDGLSVTIISGDKDLLQLVDEKITMKNPKTSKGQTTVTTYTPEDVFNEYGVTPEEFVLLKSIMGDTSDNIPGVKGIGPKTAAPIVAKYHKMDEIISHIDDISSESVKNKMQNGIDSMKLSYYLALIDTNTDIELDLSKATLQDMFNSDSLELFKKYNFKSMLARFQDKEYSFKQEKVPNVIKIDSKEDADSVINKALLNIKSGKDIGISLVRITKNDNILAFFSGDMPKAVGICFEDDKVYFINSGRDIDGSYLTDIFLKLSSEKKGKIYINDIKAAIKALGNIQDDFIDRFSDVSVIAYLADPVIGSYTYNDIALNFLNLRLPDVKELKNNEDLKTSYDAWVSYKVGATLLNTVKKADMENVYTEIEKPLIPVLSYMEKTGIKADRDALKAYSVALETQIEVLRENIINLAGEDFNINSTKALGQILFEKLKLPHGKKTKTGYSTAADVLEKLESDYPIAGDILEYRTLTKLKSTYADGLSVFIEEDGRIHGDFNQTVTATGRLSSTNPNLQNIPVRMDIGKQIRKVFIPEDGYVFIDADYSQIELRVLTHMSGDEKLIEAYKTATDIHALTASQVFKTPLSEVTPQQRRNAKAVNFGIIYGISSFGLGKGLSISVAEAKNYIESYFTTYPAIKKFLDSLVESAKKTGYSRTMFGRIRPIPELKAKNFTVRSFGERVAMNAPIQGTAADIMKIAMIRIYEKLKTNKMKSRLILQVHDEVLVEAHIDEKEEVKKIIRDSMEGAVKLKVPLTVDINEGENWYETH